MSDTAQKSGFTNIPDLVFEPSLPDEICATCDKPRVDGHYPAAGQIRYVRCNSVAGGEFHPYKPTWNEQRRFADLHDQVVIGFGSKR